MADEATKPAPAGVKKPPRAGMGRPKGVQNKTTRIAKDAIAFAADKLGGAERLVAWAKEDGKNETAFWTTIYPKLLPLQVDGQGRSASPRGCVAGRCSFPIDVAPVFVPLLDKGRYKGAHGGRGSGKCSFADLMVATAVRKPGFRGLCCREVQKSLKELAKRLIESKIERHGLSGMFDVQEAVIKTPGNGLIAFAGLQDHTSESIKSYEGFDVACVEEAQTVSTRSLNLLRPTIRSPGSELWFSWNPRLEQDAVDVMLRGETLPTGAIVVEANWKNNPWFPGNWSKSGKTASFSSPSSTTISGMAVMSR
ncbi:phage terminase large subunit [Sphingomonas sp. MMS24-JH45]